MSVTSVAVAESAAKTVAGAMDSTMTSTSTRDSALLKLECFIVFPPFYFAHGYAQFSFVRIP
jgi:hypothetical protein